MKEVFTHKSCPKHDKKLHSQFLTSRQSSIHVTKYSNTFKTLTSITNYGDNDGQLANKMIMKPRNDVKLFDS